MGVAAGAGVAPAGWPPCCGPPGRGLPGRPSRRSSREGPPAGGVDVCGAVVGGVAGRAGAAGGGEAGGGGVAGLGAGGGGAGFAAGGGGGAAGFAAGGGGGAARGGAGGAAGFGGAGGGTAGLAAGGGGDGGAACGGGADGAAGFAGGCAPFGGCLGLPSGPCSSLACATTTGAFCACDTEPANCIAVRAVVASSMRRRFVICSESREVLKSADQQPSVRPDCGAAQTLIRIYFSGHSTWMHQCSWRIQGTLSRGLNSLPRDRWRDWEWSAARLGLAESRPASCPATHWAAAARRARAGVAACQAADFPEDPRAAVPSAHPGSEEESRVVRSVFPKRSASTSPPCDGRRSRDACPSPPRWPSSRTRSRCPVSPRIRRHRA